MTYITPEEEERERWWERIANAIAPFLKASYQKDWMNAANCLADSATDTRFLAKPDPATAKQLEAICRQCPVALQCLEWADENSPTGVFIAGEWLDD